MNYIRICLENSDVGSALSTLCEKKFTIKTKVYEKNILIDEIIHADPESWSDGIVVMDYDRVLIHLLKQKFAEKAKIIVSVRTDREKKLALQAGAIECYNYNIDVIYDKTSYGSEYTTI